MRGLVNATYAETSSRVAVRPGVVVTRGAVIGMLLAVGGCDGGHVRRRAR